MSQDPMHPISANERFLEKVGAFLYFFRNTMSIFYLGLGCIMMVIFIKFLKECFATFKQVLGNELSKTDLIIRALELVDMVMVGQLLWVVAIAGYSLFVSSRYFDNENVKKPDWLDSVDTYNLKLKLAFSVISISGVHALKSYIQATDRYEAILTVTAHFLFVLCAVGIAVAIRIVHPPKPHGH
jgi:uncharacterized protein (TIGR00645 family)